MATELLELQLEELSLVDRPANAEAIVTLLKRDDTQEEDITKMTEEQDAKIKAYMEKHNCGKDEAMKALGYEMEKAADDVDPILELNAEIDKLKADTEKLTKENERLRKGLIEEGYIIKSNSIEKKDSEEFVEYEGEKIKKSDIPKPILKALEAAEFEKADMELTDRAKKTLPHFSVGSAKGLLSALDKSENKEELEAALKAADAALSDKMEEVGISDVDGNFASSSDKLEHMVKVHMNKNSLTKKDYAKAYAAVAKTSEGKSLISQVYKETN